MKLWIVTTSYIRTVSVFSSDTNTLSSVIFAENENEAVGQAVKQGMERWPDFSMNGVPHAMDISETARAFSKLYPTIKPQPDTTPAL